MARTVFMEGRCLTKDHRVWCCLLATLVVVVGIAGCRVSDKQPAEDRTESAERPGNQPNTPPRQKNGEIIQQHRALAQKGVALTDEQRKHFARAYYRAGMAHWRSGQRAQAEPYLREALRLWPQHAAATFRLGDLCAMRRQFRAAAEAYERAGKLDASLKAAVTKRRTRLSKVALAIADQRLADSRIAGAKEALDFIEQYLSDIGGSEARARLKQVEPLLQAEQLLTEAQQDVRNFRKPDGFKKLRQVATEYPRTYFGQEANRLLEANGQKIVLRDTATGFKLPPHWRRTSSEHFEIYHERTAAVASVLRYGEQAFSRIVTDYGMDDADWKTRVTVYVFSDGDSWRAFLGANRDKAAPWAGGFALPWANEIYLYVTDRKSYLYKRVLPHELTHVLHHRYVGETFQPLWLKEGLAISQEKGGIKEARKAIDDLVREGDAFPLKKLFDLTYYPPQAIGLFYAQSATLVGFMIEEFGLDSFKEFMFTFANTEDTAEAIQAAYGISLDTFRKKWEKYVR